MFERHAIQTYPSCILAAESTILDIDGGPSDRTPTDLAFMAR